eukprot:Seg2587.2 transcript_id=Seg2587.2/GoldUCD/mRNA.D3Y31 product="hypothetical protein" protein_id=Seg2587.2/GoldUCD/D3Y31
MTRLARYYMDDIEQGEHVYHTTKTNLNCIMHSKNIPEDDKKLYHQPSYFTIISKGNLSKSKTGFQFIKCSQQAATNDNAKASNYITNIFQCCR